MSSWVVFMLMVCGAVRDVTSNLTVIDDEFLNPEKTTEEDVRVLLKQLTARVEELERERENRGQSSRAKTSIVMFSYFIVQQPQKEGEVCPDRDLVQNR